MEKLKTLLNEIKVSKFTYLYILYNLFIRNRKWNKKILMRTAVKIYLSSSNLKKERILC